MKKKMGKPPTPAHTMKSKMLKTDSFGSGVKNPMARDIDVYGVLKTSNGKAGKAPKSLA